MEAYFLFLKVIGVARTKETVKRKITNFFSRVAEGFSKESNLSWTTSSTKNTGTGSNNGTNSNCKWCLEEGAWWGTGGPNSPRKTSLKVLMKRTF